MNKNFKRDVTINAHFRTHYKALVKRMTHRVPDKSVALAEEVVQEAYARALQYWRTYDPERGDFERWFNLILNNTASSKIREENGISTLSLDEEDRDYEPFFLNEEMDIPRDIVIKVQEAIKEQPSDVRDVLNMFFNLGMKTTDIEKCTRYSHTNIRQIIRRFRIRWDDENTFRDV